MTLGRSIVLLLSGLLLGTGLFVGGVGFFAAKSSITELRGILLTQVDGQVQQRLQAYFDRVEPALEFIEEAVFDDPKFIENWKTHAPLLTEFIKTEPDIIWLYYAEEKTGHLLGVNVDPDGRYIVSRVHTDNNRISRGYEVQPDDSITEVELLPVNPGEYDPRERPWYRQAVEAKGTAWTPPYQFVESDIIGITAARAVRTPDNKIRGVLAADLELQRIGVFLDSFEIAKGGGAFLLLEDGSPVVPERKRTIPNVGPLHGAMAVQRWDLSTVKSGETIELEFTHAENDYLAMIQELALPGKTRYFGAVVVPSNAYLEKVTRNALITMVACGGIFFLAIILGIWQARRVTTPLEKLGDELEQIGNLSFRDSGLQVRSPIREVAMFSDSVGKMKISLRAFSRYVPRDLVRLLLARGEEAKLGGELRKVTAVFTDLAGFTSMSESLSPDEAFNELSVFLEIIATTQEKYHGITSNFTGDGTLALFNAPEELPNHGTNACLAALEALETLNELNEQRRDEGKFEFKARIGINTAEVLLGNLGTRERFAYTAIGDGVNLASRIEGLGKLYRIEILVGGDCHYEVGDEIEWRLVDRISVVGRHQANDIYQPLGKKREVDSKILLARNAYEAALQKYFEGEFAEALVAFRSSESVWPNGEDPPTRVMIERLERLLKTGESAPPDWNGIYEVQSK
jgi:adenylate cyclase